MQSQEFQFFKHVNYAGVSARQLAFVCDYIFFSALILWPLGQFFPKVDGQVFGLCEAAWVPIGMLLYIAFLCSPWMATPGKRILNIQVKDEEEKPLKPWMAAGRYLVFIIPFLAIAGMTNYFSTKSLMKFPMREISGWYEAPTVDFAQDDDLHYQFENAGRWAMEDTWNNIKRSVMTSDFQYFPAVFGGCLALFAICFVPMKVNDKRQGLHDWAVRSVVLRKEKL